jgi:hypothetical protein
MKGLGRGSENAAQYGGLAERANQGAGVLGLQRDRLRGRSAAESAGASDIPATVFEVRG